MPRPSAPLPPPLDAGPFSLREAQAAGVTRRRLRHPDVAHPHHGRYAPTPAADLRARCAHALGLLGLRRLFSHVTAARLWGMPLPAPEQEAEPLHVIALGGAEPLRRPGIVGWESAGGTARRVLDGLPVADAAAVWVQLAVPGSLGRDPITGRRRPLDPDWLVAVGDFVLTGPRPAPGEERRPLASLADLRAAARAHHGKRGAKALGAALPLLRRGPQSPRESLLRLALVRHGLPEPVVQPAVATADGIRHADLGYPDERLLIEYQGDHHRTDQQQWRADLRRRDLFRDAGYRLVEVTMDDFADGGTALAWRIRRALASR